MRFLDPDDPWFGSDNNWNCAVINRLYLYLDV